MRILLDESLPRDLGREIPGHEVTTVQQAGWAGVQNGELLPEYQQNPALRPLIPELAGLGSPKFIRVPRSK